MFNFFNSARARHSTIRQALVNDGVSGAADPAALVVLENVGRYSGRRVRFFRAFEPGNEGVLVAEGHVEHEGTVVIVRRPVADGGAPARLLADRSTHTDDERLVFWHPSEAPR